MMKPNSTDCWPIVGSLQKPLGSGKDGIGSVGKWQNTGVSISWAASEQDSEHLNVQTTFGFGASLANGSLDNDMARQISLTVETTGQ